jgi:hypothetical protein
MPGPVAALTLTTLKVCGYSVFARVVSTRYVELVRPLAFAATKTFLGFIGGFLFLGAMSVIGSGMPMPVILVGATFVRLGIWLYALRRFFPLTTTDTRVLWQLSAAGLACTYVLDAATFAMVYALREAPGMMMGVC